MDLVCCLGLYDLEENSLKSVLQKKPGIVKDIRLWNKSRGDIIFLNFQSSASMVSIFLL